MIAKTKIQLKDREYQYFEDMGNDGMFFLSNEKGQLVAQYSCREELKYEWHNNNYIGFAFDNLNIKGINEILEYAEKRLKLPKSQKSLIYLTNYENIVLIKVSSFWLESVIRKDVFSLLLRCGAVYYIESVKQAFDSYKLTKRCLPALDLFLNGYTKLNFSISPIVKDIYGEYTEEDFYENFDGFVDYTRQVGLKKLKNNYLIKG